MRAKPKANKTTNEFHKIRQREMEREARCLQGQPTNIMPCYFTPSLREICAKVIADTFERQPSLDGLRDLEKDLYRLVIDQLRVDLPLEVSVPRVSVQEYWRACCEARWSSGQLAQCTPSLRLEPPERGGWKRVYLERNLEEHLMSLENATMNEKDEEAMVGLCSLCGAEIYSLKLTSQRCHFDIYELFAKLPHLEQFAITYGVRNAGIAFKMDMLGLKPTDALSLQKVLKTFPSLVSLALPGNNMEDDMLKCVMAGLVRNTTLLHLDLSHNRIDDNGAAAIATVLQKRDLALKTLDLTDNLIRADGAFTLGRALSNNSVLQVLSLRLNRLGDVGGQHIFDGLRANKALTSLNVSTNELAAESARSLAELMRVNATLCKLDASCNAFGEEGGRVVLTAVEASTALTEVDTRRSGIDAKDEDAMARLLQKRVTAQRMTKIESVESQMRSDIQKMVAEKVRRSRGV